MKFKLALAQMAPRLGDVETNLRGILALAAQAHAQGADLAIFPELALTGYYLKDLVTEVGARPAPDDPRFAPLLAASRQLDLVVGFVEEDARHRYYIAAAYLSEGRVVSVHRKVYLPTYRLFDDARFFAPGNSFRAFDTRFGRVGLLICEDAWHVSSPYVLWMDGADILIDVSASPGYGVPAHAPNAGSSMSGELMNAATVNTFLRTYAELLTTYVFYSNRVGVEDGIAFWGGSRVIGPDGETVAAAPQFEETLMLVDIDLDALRRARLKLPTLRDEQSELVRHELGRIAKRELDR
ncbi:MAG: carbon-nitrogen hydrolase [Chloroflexota bacterium]|nr:carbon-nitrogen hydrolase [Chloroflexota bacterium]